MTLTPPEHRPVLHRERAAFSVGDLIINRRNDPTIGVHPNLHPPARKEPIRCASATDGGSSQSTPNTTVGVRVRDLIARDCQHGHQPRNATVDIGAEC
jgi:hypothetical protein